MYVQKVKELLLTQVGKRDKWDREHEKMLDKNKQHLLYLRRRRNYHFRIRDEKQAPFLERHSLFTVTLPTTEAIERNYLEWIEYMDQVGPALLAVNKQIENGELLREEVRSSFDLWAEAWKFIEDISPLKDEVEYEAEAEKLYQKLKHRSDRRETLETKFELGRPAVQILTRPAPDWLLDDPTIDDILAMI